MAKLNLKLREILKEEPLDIQAIRKLVENSVYSDIELPSDIRTLRELLAFLTDYIATELAEIRDSLNLIETAQIIQDEVFLQTGYDIWAMIKDPVQSCDAICPVCKTVVPAGTRFCPKCGMICGADTRKR